MSVALLSVAAVALDALLGEPKRGHPLVAFGRLAERIERRFNPGGRGWRSHGVTAWCLAVLPPTLLAWLLSLVPQVGWLLEVLALYAALGLRSLGEHAAPVARALCDGDLPEARRRVGYMVSRQTAELDPSAVARAGTESVLENGS
ncbi:MAG: cobalamin biosynthesis protein, partial [Pseudomonas sp.]